MKTQTPLLPLTNPWLDSSSSSSSSSKHQSLTLPKSKETTMFSKCKSSSSNDLLTSHLSMGEEHDDDDSKVVEKRPLLSRAFSFGAGGRRRSSSDDCGSDHSFASNVEHVASEVNLVSMLSTRLLAYLGVGYRWITRFLALGCYSILIMPGFIQVGHRYFFSHNIQRSIVYGDQPRNRLDLYVPKEGKGPHPVVAFVTGGAWIIGYKAWGALLGLQLSERGIMVACIDYRNFPQGTIKNMIEDASSGIAFVCKNITEYGGDPNRIYVMGQSAGAHISACTLVEQAIKEADYSIPCDASKDFADILKGLGAEAQTVMYEGKTHTDVFVQDSLRGGTDQMFEDIVGYIHAGDEEALARDAVAPPRKQLVPECMLKLARAVSPF